MPTGIKLYDCYFRSENFGNFLRAGSYAHAVLICLQNFLAYKSYPVTLVFIG